MCAVRLLRVSVHERISAAAEDFLLQLEKGEEAAELPALRALLTERLTAAAEEIVGLLEETVAEYEDRVERSEREICRQRRLLDAVLKPEVRLHRADLQQLLVNNEKKKKMERSGSETSPEAETDGSWNQLKNRKLETQNGTKGHTGKNRFSCSLCGKSFSKIAGLSYHLKIHSGEKSFSCSVCRKKFRKKGHLKYHVLIHTGVKPFSCSVCHRTFRWPSQIKIHKCVQEAPQCLHNKLKKPLSCSTCGEKFSDGSLLTSHRRIHQEKKKMLSCSVCGLQRRFHSQMKLHMRSHTGEKPYSCSSCSKKFSRKAMLTQHMVVHSKVKPFSCVECGKRFCWNFQIKKHRCPAKLSAAVGLFKQATYKKSKESVESEDSDSDFWRKTRKHWSGFTYNRTRNDRESNREYINMMKPLRCPNNETKAEHQNEARDTPSALTSEQYCKVSETLNRKTVIQKFACREGLSQHMFHTEIQMEVKQEKPETTDIKEEQTELELTGLKEEQQETDTAECIFSSVPLKTEDDEEKPQSSKLHHRHSVEKPHPVSQPDNEMSDPSETDVSDGDWEETSEAWSDLNGPVVPLSCNDQKSFVCPVCGKIFGRKGNLETHLRTHTGERPFSCHLCNKTFTTKLIMKMHMSVHTGEKRFTCHVCGKKFNWHSQIKYHKCVQNQTAEAELHLGTTSVKTDNTESQSGSNCDDESEDGEVFTQSRCLQTNCQTRENSGSHSDEKPLKNESQRELEDRDAQLTHPRQSTAEKPFSCSLCGKGFATGGCLTRHTSIHTGEKLLSCFICEKTFNEESELISHECVGKTLQRHQTEEQITANKTFSCSVCPERFSRREDFSFHFRRHPRCSVCNAGFSDRDSLVQHMRSHTSQTQFLCSVCGKDFAWRRHLTKHMEDHAKKKLYHCGICGRKFTCPKKLSHHWCVRRSSQLLLSSSAEHMEADGEDCGEPEPEPYLQAETEDKAAESSDPDTDDSDCWKENRRAQYTSEKHHKVPESDTTLYRKTFIQQLPYGEDLSQHMVFHSELQREEKQKDIQEEQEEPELTAIKEEQEDTAITKFIFSSLQIKTEEDEEKPQSSQLHQRDSVREPEPDLHPDSDVGGVYFKSDDSVDSDFWKDTRQRQSGNDSDRNLFSSSEETNLQPESDDSTDSDFWKSHSGSNSLQHDGISDREVKDDAKRKPYSCTECSKTFHYIFHMKTHMKLHTEERPFFCSICGQKCLYKSHLKIHMRTHTGEKPFVCPICGKKYAHKASMQSHMSEHAKHYSCSVCERSFAWYTELKYHQCAGESSHRQTYRRQTM